MLNIKTLFPLHLSMLVCACLALAPTWAASQDVLVEGNGVTVTVTDVMADLQRLPPETRKNVLMRPDSITQLATGLYQRRVLALEAERAGLAAEPVVQASLRISRDRTLSDAKLAQLDAAAVSDDAALDALALNSYRANSERFRQPAQIRARHILISAQTDGARDKAQALLKQLQNGANFEDLARQNSQDPGSAARGGDLGFFASGRMVPQFDAAAFALQRPGDLSGIVETNFGFHIIRLEETRAGGIRSFEDVKPELRKELGASLIKARRDQEVQRLMQGARFNQDAVQALSQAPR